jgi:hypothetical protein
MKRFLLSLAMVLALPVLAAGDAPFILDGCNMANATLSEGTLVRLYTGTTTLPYGQVGVVKLTGNSTNYALGSVVNSCTNATLCKIAVAGVSKVILEGTAAITPGARIYAGKTAGYGTNYNGTSTHAGTLEFIGYAVNGNTTALPQAIRVFLRPGAIKTQTAGQ